MVTKTHDIALARGLINAKLVAHGWHLQEEIDAGETFSAAMPVLEIGRIVPASGDEWFWRVGTAADLGKPGATRAVVWYE